MLCDGAWQGGNFVVQARSEADLITHGCHHHFELLVRCTQVLLQVFLCPGCVLKFLLHHKHLLRRLYNCRGQDQSQQNEATAL